MLGGVDALDASCVTTSRLDNKLELVLGKVFATALVIIDESCAAFVVVCAALEEVLEVVVDKAWKAAIVGVLTITDNELCSETDIGS